jgi:GT2 family glycosyltransferase
MSRPRLERPDIGEQRHRPRATVIIPSKDRPDLLEACWAGLAQTRPEDFEVVIVDNGSENVELLTLYDRLKADPRVRIRYRPGPFNFSELCNSGAEAAEAPVIVFLNNDVIAGAPDWLDTMIAWAVRSDVGAVGTTLVYPSGRVQHAGVVIGLAGYAAHIERDAEADQRGYMRRLIANREVSAVTAACLAVEKAKFESVGGFDEKTFPIELNDIDLCLRLSAAGWTTICLAEPVLVHHESATRGTARDMDKIYGQERRQFRDRWSAPIRDDPFFHPALSLHSIATALDQ